MGCDIHAYSEYKSNDYGFRQMGGKAENYRNYEFFGIVAGVRKESEFGKEPKGFPEDSSSEIEIIHDYWGDDAHSASWLSLDEITWLYQKYKEQNPNPVFLLHDYFESWIKELERLPGTDKRIVFWFDN